MMPQLTCHWPGCDEPVEQREGRGGRRRYCANPEHDAQKMANLKAAEKKEVHRYTTNINAITATQFGWNLTPEDRIHQTIKGWAAAMESTTTALQAGLDQLSEGEKRLTEWADTDNVEQRLSEARIEVERANLAVADAQAARDEVNARNTELTNTLARLRDEHTQQVETLQRQVLAAQDRADATEKECAVVVNAARADLQAAQDAEQRAEQRATAAEQRATAAEQRATAAEERADRQIAHLTEQLASLSSVIESQGNRT
jgi:chromosome segregation ATPase